MLSPTPSVVGRVPAGKLPMIEATQAQLQRRHTSVVPSRVHAPMDCK
jgi:hypothetical protein